MLPSILARQLRVALADYVETTYPMTNPVFQGSMRKMADTPGALLHEPYVNVRLPFRISEDQTAMFQAVDPVYKPYVHQQLAYQRLVGEDGRSTLIAAGTGSGKTECFLYPILDYCYAHRGERGIKALIIYPMNALATDQARRMAKEINDNPKLRGNVTAGLYVGGQQAGASTGMTRDQIITDRDTMLASPPDILLTNYKMLDYLLIRPRDAQLWKDNQPNTLKHIVVDELHTFDGAQGTDLACLLRRLKNRLFIQPGYLCCVGTSATMGGDDSAESIRQYAERIFGEDFEPDSVITEDRLSALEFFGGYEVTDYSMPSAADALNLEEQIGNEDQRSFLALAAESWFPAEFDPGYLFSDQGRIDLANRLMGHSFMRHLIDALASGFKQPTEVIKDLAQQYLVLLDLSDATVALDSFLALISHARIRDGHDKLQPFLHVQVQVWLRELRRLLAKVSTDDIAFTIASDLNDQQIKQYLPVLNCRDCGETGWASYRDENRGTLASGDLDKFYNLFFRQDKRIVMAIPQSESERGQIGASRARLCPDCLTLTTDNGTASLCSCGKDTIFVWVPPLEIKGQKKNQRYVCPSCGSEGGLSIMGLQAVTAISALLSQLYSSRYNDDKKLLAFSDNVQDAAHRAGVFNARTWSFSLRSAIQQFALDGGDSLPLSKFAPSFVDYWQDKLTPEEFVATFIPPNLTWRHPFERMQEEGVLGDDSHAQVLLGEIQARLEYEVLLELGLRSRIGRTLEKSSCAVLALDQNMLDPVMSRALHRLRNEVGELRELSEEDLQHIIAGWLHHLKTNGAFDHPIYELFIEKNANSYFLSNDFNRWLPSLRKVPRFITRARTPHNRGFDVPAKSSWYGRWINKHFEFEVVTRSELYSDIAAVLVEELRNHRILKECHGPGGMPVWALNPDAFRISTRVTQLVCAACGNVIAVAEDDAVLWEGSFCVREGCLGHLHPDQTADLDYYGKLYSQGDIARIIAREHTGLLTRDDRENLEAEFKRSGSGRKPWDANLLSSTPTLEMGIDIGDLSTVVLCNVPPGQSQYLQRVGRAGRKDGNSLSIAVANAQPHDLYFFAEPLEMISGQVQPPDVFLNASAVLERQFVAFCMDNWVRSGVREQAIPRKLGSCLSKLVSRPDDFFPFNFLRFIQANLATLHRTFVAMFTGLSEQSLDDLRLFARGSGSGDSPMHVRILESFESVAAQKSALQASTRQLGRMIGDLKSKPQDSSFEEEIRKLVEERDALASVVKSINNKNVFNFLSDEGLLPNYAFPEAGIVLKAVLYRRERTGEAQGGKSKRITYEYTRPASTAISEFAPANSFYAGGRKLTIDRVDLTTTQSEEWRLCPNCSYAQQEAAIESIASCPLCGDVGWADAGQVRSMLQVQMVYTDMEYSTGLIGDEERRSNVFYLRQMLVDVDPQDIISAYRVGTDEFPFGYEFVRKAKLREINFGEKDIVGEKFAVAGVEEVRRGFLICRSCGKVQKPDGPPAHTMTCPVRKQVLHEPYEECMYLYRQFDTEALRILIPSTTMEWSKERQESFVAGFMLGMRGHFGNVDHLNACVSEVPVEDSAYRKQYLVIYDSVPGGTGYLKQLMRSESSMLEILEKAVSILENCSCKDDPQKDGCYRCLYAYRQSRHIGNISRRMALDLFRTILAGRENIEQVPSIGSIPTNSLFESELERQFIGAFENMGSDRLPIKIHKALVNNKEGYSLQVGQCLWTIELQVDMDARRGVLEPSRADFVFRPQRSMQKQRPVVVYTDGFKDHKKRVCLDTLQRLAISTTEQFRLWSLTWKDVTHVLGPSRDYHPAVLDPVDMPSGSRMYKPIIDNGKAGALQPDILNSFELLIQYLANPDAENLFSTHAKAYALSLLQPEEMAQEPSFQEWNAMVQPLVESLDLFTEEPVFGDTLFGRWEPPKTDGYLSAWAGVSRRELGERKLDCAPAVVWLFEDKGEWDRVYEANWNAFWTFSNMMQFLPRFAPVTRIGLEEAVYASLSAVALAAEIPMTESADETWTGIFENIFDDFARMIASEMATAGLPAPSTLGYAETDASGVVLAEAEMAWEAERVVWLLPSQGANKQVFESLGWTVYVGEEIPEIQVLRQEA